MALYKEESRKRNRMRSKRIKFIKEYANLFPLAFAEPINSSYWQSFWHKGVVNNLGLEAGQKARDYVGYSKNTGFGDILISLNKTWVNSFSGTRNKITWHIEGMLDKDTVKMTFTYQVFEGCLWYDITQSDQHLLLVDDVHINEGFRKFFNKRETITEIEKWINSKVFELV